MSRDSDNGGRTLALTHYIDDSGSDEKSSLAVMGGPVFDRNGFLALEREWTHTLSSHEVEPPIHMKEFARPHGRLARLTDNDRRALFTDLVRLINRRKAYGLTVAVDNLQFQQFFPSATFRGIFGPTPLAFLWCMVLNRSIGKDLKHQSVKKMDYVLSNAPVNSQMTDTYNFFHSFEVYNAEEFTGAIAFDPPNLDSALQAADMVAWANRKKDLDGSFGAGFEPLALLTPPQGFAKVRSSKPLIHFHYKVRNESTKDLATILGMPNRTKGKRANFLGVISKMKKGV